MLQLDPRLIAGLTGRDLIAFGTGGLGKIVIPYLAQEPDIKLHGVTNSRITAVDAGTFLDTKLPIRSLDAWAKRMPDAAVLLCVVRRNEAASREACKAAGFREIITVPFYLVDMLQDLYNPGRVPLAHPMLHMMCLANELRDLHKAAFAEFKGCHRGQTVAVVGTGPSLNYYSQIEGVPHIGTNSSVLKQDLHLDYYFARHYWPEWCEGLKNYPCVKFFARNEWAERHNPHDRFPEYVIEENGGRRFFTSEPNREIYADITRYPLAGYYSIIFQALQFAIYTRPQKILLIGCDCTCGGHYEHGQDAGEERLKENLQDRFLPNELLVPLWIEGYEQFKTFAGQLYPDMEIVSVNPEGLKGMFRDVYTKSCLDARPELNRMECEILDPSEF